MEQPDSELARVWDGSDVGIFAFTSKLRSRLWAEPTTEQPLAQGVMTEAQLSPDTKGMCIYLFSSLLPGEINQREIAVICQDNFHYRNGGGKVSGERERDDAVLNTAHQETPHFILPRSYLMPAPNLQHLGNPLPIVGNLRPIKKIIFVTHIRILKKDRVLDRIVQT